MTNLIIVLLFKLLLLSGCFSCPAEEYFGSWEAQNGYSNSIVIESDGSFTANIFDWGWQRHLLITGSWKFEENRLSFGFVDPTYPVYATISDNDELRLHYMRGGKGKNYPYRTLSRVTDIKRPTQTKQRQFRIYPIDMETIPNDSVKILLSGQIAFPGLYYWPRGKTIEDLIEFSVPLKFAVTDSFILIRENGRTLERLEISVPESEHFEIRDGDCIYIDYYPL